MNFEKFIPFSQPDINDNEISEVIDTLKSGWITTGPKVSKFEDKFKSFLDIDSNVIAVNSATAGLHLALESLGISKGDQIIVPTLTFTASASIVRYLGAEVRFVDINPKTLNIDLNQIKKYLNKKTKAIIVVHYAGLACDMDKIIKLAKKYNIKVIEDAAHALPTKYKGRIVGSLKSDITVFSFYANKTMTTGEGGMVVTKNKKLAERIRIMRLHGIDRSVYNRFSSQKPAWFYKVIAPGYKYNMTDLAASIGLQQLDKLSSFLERRTFLAKKYFDSLNELPLILPHFDDYLDSHAWHLFVIRLKNVNQNKRDNLINYLFENKVGTSLHYTPLHRHPYWKKRYNLKNKMFPNADAAYKSMLSIPLYTRMSNDDQNRVIYLLREFFNDKKII